MENMDCESLTHRTKMGADKLAKNTPNAECPKICLPKLSAQDQKFWISMKKGLIGPHCLKSIKLN